MIIVADRAVPFVDYYFAVHARIIRVPAADIDAALLAQTAADALVIRSKTQVTNTLLVDSQVRYVLSCVSGTDHLSDNLPAQVQCYSAPGCNALAVAQYMQQVLSSLSLAPDTIVGVVGVGAVGSHVVSQLVKQGFSVLQCDPFRASEPGFQHHALVDLLPQIDVLCLHVPLTHDGPHPTHNMLDSNALGALKSGAVIINASRGEVIDEAALLRHWGRLNWCLDVWQNEPRINAELARQAYIATPHIAGHTWLGKVQGTHDCYHQLAQVLGWPAKPLPDPPRGDVPHAKLLATSEILKQDPMQFQVLREEYCSC